MNSLLELDIIEVSQEASGREWQACGNWNFLERSGVTHATVLQQFAQNCAESCAVLFYCAHEVHDDSPAAVDGSSQSHCPFDFDRKV